MKERKQGVGNPAANEYVDVITGDMIYNVHNNLWAEGMEMEDITVHLEYLYDRKQYHGLIYFIFILANAVDLQIPLQFTQLSADNEVSEILAASIIENWLECF